MNRIVILFLGLVCSIESFGISSDQEMGAASLEEWAQGVITDPIKASQQFTTDTVTVDGNSVKEYRGKSSFGHSSTPLIRISSANGNYEVNFGYTKMHKEGPNVRMDRFSRNGDTAVYTYCTAAGCVSVTPDICANIGKDANQKNYEKLLDCGNLLAKVGSYYDSTKLKALTESEVSKFNSAMPPESKVDTTYRFSSADIADSKLSSAIKHAAILINNCQKFEKTKFSSMLSPVNLGGEAKTVRESTSR